MKNVLEVWCRGRSSLKGGRGGSCHFFYFIFQRFIIFTFRNCFTLFCKIVFAKLCYAFEERFMFFCPHNLMKKSHSKLSKNEPDNIP